MDKDREKQAVARAGLNFIQDGQVVGLGSGSTSAFFIQFLGERVRAGLQIRSIPTSMRAQQLANEEVELSFARRLWHRFPRNS